MRATATGGAPPRRVTSLRRAYGRLLLVSSTLPAVVFALVMLADHHASERQVLAERLASSAVVTADGIEKIVEGHLTSVALLADIRSASTPDWPADLTALRTRHPGLTTALAADREGNLLALAPASRLPSGDTPNVADRDYFQQPAHDLQPYVSNAFRGRGVGTEPLVAVSAPLLREGAFDGVVEGSIRTDALIHEQGRAYVRRGYELALFDRSGRVIFATPAYDLEFVEHVDLDARFGPPSSLGLAQSRDALFGDGAGGLVARTPMRSGWTLVLAARDAELISGLANRGWMLLITLLLVTMGILLASWWQMRQLEGGTRGLLRAMSGLGPGERLPAGTLAHMPVELAPVAQAIDALAKRLDEAYAGMARLGRLSRTDALTGALNVRGQEEWMALKWPDLQASGADIGLLAVDIDRFKSFNDTYGHPPGDVALKRVVGAMRGALRGSDDEIVRTGGEEFLVLLPTASADTTREVGERIRSAVQDAGIPQHDSPDGVVTVSLGMALARTKGEADPALQRARARADQALSRAKRAGRNRLEA
ncbi:diguanylate cyclase [soil metagenome]